MGPRTGPSDGELALGLRSAAGMPAGGLPLWSAASLRQHVEVQTDRVRLREAERVCANMYV